MVKEMRRRTVERALRTHQCEEVPGGGRHDKWRCPCGSHSTAVPRHREVSPGVVRNIINDLACLPEGWLQ